jgi:hypothetical protein
MQKKGSEGSSELDVALMLDNNFSNAHPSLAEVSNPSGSSVELLTSLSLNHTSSFPLIPIRVALRSNSSSQPFVVIH